MSHRTGVILATAFIAIPGAAVLLPWLMAATAIASTR